MEGYETYIEVEDVKIHIEVYGAGEPIIFLHGNGGSTRSFDKQIPFFASIYQVICIDTRGHGKSDLGKEHLDFSILASDVIKVMDKLEIESANIVGFSDGGNTAITLALNYPGRVKSITTSGANLFPEGLVEYIFPPMQIGYVTTNFFKIFSKKMKIKNELFSLLVKHPHINPEELTKIKVPALIMAGDRDLIKREHTDLITKSIKNSIQYIVTDCDHFIADEKPDEFNSALSNFLKDIVYKKQEYTNDKKN